MTGKSWNFQISANVWNHWKWIWSSLRQEAEVNGVWKWVSSQMQRGNDDSHKNVKAAENYGPHFWEGSEKESHIRHAHVKSKPFNKHLRTSIKYRKKIQGLCHLSFSPLMTRFSFYPATATTHMLFLSPMITLKV